MLQNPFPAFSVWLRNRLLGRNEEQSSDSHEAYRKCPKCQAGDFRVSDRQRLKPDVYGSRTLRLKWLCLTCGNRETEIVEGPD